MKSHEYPDVDKWSISDVRVFRYEGVHSVLCCVNAPIVINIDDYVAFIVNYVR